MRHHDSHAATEPRAAHSAHHAFGRMGKAAKGAVASVAVIAFAAATAFGSFALAQPGTGDAGPTATDGQSQQQDGQSQTWDAQADGTVNQIPSSDSQSGTGAQSQQDSSSSDSSDGDGTSSNGVNGGNASANQSQSSNSQDQNQGSADGTGAQSQQDSNGGTTGTSADQGTGTGSDDASNNTVNVDPSTTEGDVGANAQVQQSPADADSRQQADADQPAAQADDADCAAVTTWDELKACVPQSGTVTITIAKAIDAATTIAIPAGVNVTLTAADGISPALTATAAGDSLFSVASGATLTIGNALSYAGTEAAPAHRRLATVNAGGSIVFDGGRFEWIHITGNGAAVLSNGGAVTVNGGTFAHNTADNGGVVRANDGTVDVKGGEFTDNTAPVSGVIGAYGSTKVTIDGGTFRNNTAIKPGAWNGGGVVRLADTASLDVNGGTFTDNKALGDGGGVVYSMGAGNHITIADGTFDGNVSSNTGGAIFNQGTLTVAGGTFTGNDALQFGGGAIFSNATATISGGTFTGNAQKVGTIGDDGTVTYADCSTEATWGTCKKGSYGGGAIRSDGDNATLTIEGKVRFEGNHANGWATFSGGGALYVRGILWVKNDLQGNKPQFIGNWAGVKDTPYNDDGSIPAGGAGGAIFVQNKGSVAYFMGGEFSKNVSGYLGGAVYTEEDSTSYVAKAVATANTAGHFGGGFWLCPSGTGTASKGGNIALYDNKLDSNLDANTDNHSAGKGGTQVTAGHDFAIMNPYSKHDAVKSNFFQLMDTWFTDRTETAVQWGYDGEPIKDASGFADGWQKGGVNDNRAITANEKGGDVKVDADTHTKTLTLRYNGRYGNGSKERPFEDMSCTASDTDETAGNFCDVGVALKSTVLGNAADAAARKAGAWNTASVKFSDNAARLSGGAFGTNGTVQFSTPYTASWTKVDLNTKQEIGGAEWLLTGSEGTTKVGDKDDLGNDITTKDAAFTVARKRAAGPYSIDFYPSVCPVNADGTLTEAGATAYNAGTCWKETASWDDVTQTWTITRSAIIKDNTGTDAYVGFDNNPDSGGFDINNLANGVYTLTERRAPVGYEPELDDQGNVKSYTFDVDNKQGIWNKDTADETTNQEINNTPLSGASWKKVDANDRTYDLAGSEWTVTRIKDANGNPVTEKGRTVTDCVDATLQQPADGTKITCETDPTNVNTATTYADKSGGTGDFNIQPEEAGTYRLEEKTVPGGYWQTNGTYHYEFTIDKDAQNADGTKKNADLYKVSVDGNGNVVSSVKVEDKQILNAQPQVSWSKVSAADPNGATLTGSAWEIAGPYSAKDSTDEVTGVAAFTAPVTDCSSTSDAASKCNSHTNANVKGADGVITEYKDTDPAEGRFRVLGLPSPLDSKTTYWYKLTETKAPSGYVLPAGVSYWFAVSQPEPTAEVTIDAASGVSKSLAVKHDVPGATNAIPNVTHISALPFTGGRAARDWAIVGGGLALVAGLVYAAVNWYRSRKGLEA